MILLRSILKAHVSASSYVNAHGTAVNRKEHEDSRASALESLRSHQDHRVRSYARKILGSDSSYELHKIRRDRFGHLPHWNSLDDHTRQAILDAEEEKSKGHKEFEEWVEKHGSKKGTKKESVKVDRSGWEQQLMFKSGLWLLRKSKHDVSDEERDYRGRWAAHSFKSGKETIKVGRTGKHSNDFILFNGVYDLTTMPKLKKSVSDLYPQLPIRLRVGWHSKLFGEEHLGIKHASELANYKMTPAQYVYHVIKNTSKIYEIDRMSGKLLLECTGNPRGSMYVQLKNNGEFYSVVSLYDNTRSRNKGEEVWSGRNMIMTPEARHDDPFEKATTTNLSARLLPRPDRTQDNEMSPKYTLDALGNQTNCNIPSTANKLKKTRNPLHLVRRRGC